MLGRGVSPACGYCSLAGQEASVASPRGGVPSSATGWRENKSHDLEAACTPRASLAKDALLMKLKQIHGRV